MSYDVVDQMRILLTLLATLTLTACMMGDPRTTELENKSDALITVIYTDGAFNISETVQIGRNGSHNLWPNYRFSDLAALKILDGNHSFVLHPALRAKLEKSCSGFCTLTYEGSGRLLIRTWEGFDKQ